MLSANGKSGRSSAERGAETEAQSSADADGEQRARLLESEVIRRDTELRDDDAVLRQRVVYALADVSVANRLLVARALDDGRELRGLLRFELGYA